MDNNLKYIIGKLRKNKTIVNDKHSREKKIGELTKILKELGFEYLDSGLNRMVYRRKDVVVKLELNRHNNKINQNEREVKNYLNASAKLKRLLLPILAYAKDYSWLIMPYARTPKNTSRLLKKFNAEIKKAGVIYEDSVLDSGVNLGIFHSKVYILDYGYTILEENEQEIRI